MNTTADSNLTKRALAAAMKELMEQMPFSKISVSDIAEQCGMNRKSFYYHFKDKYDLVNWSICSFPAGRIMPGSGIFLPSCAVFFTKTALSTGGRCALRDRIPS